MVINISMNRFIVCLPLLFTSAAFASPTVTGDTITWPEGDWYQVQTSDTYESICNGGSSCTVSPGIYIVINHSTGERFNNIEVGASGSQSEVIVTGNTLSYSTSGWYQVQRADDFSEVCNGETSCVVEAGTYNVINHSSGQRFDGVVVVGGGSTPQQPGDSGNVRAPADVSIQIYSGTAAELFWTPIPFTESIDGVEIRRDGILIATTPGDYVRSYFDDTRSPGVNYTYTLTAFSSAGRASTVFSGSGGGSVVTDPVEQPSDGELPTDTALVLDSLFAIANGDAIQTVSDFILRLANSPSAVGLVEESTFTDFDDTVFTRYNCPNGGTASISAVTGDSNIGTYQSMETNGCVVGSITLNLTPTVISVEGSDSLAGLLINNFLGFNWADTSDNTTISALGFGVTFERDASTGSVTGDMARSQVNSLNVLSADGSRYFIERLDVTASNVFGFQFGRGDLSITADGVIGVLPSLSRITTSTPLAGSDGRTAARPVWGEFNISGGDFSYRFNASSGNPDTFLLTVGNGTSVISYTVPYSAQRSFTLIEADASTGN